MSQVIKIYGMVWYGRVERCPTYIDDFTRHVTQPTRHSTEGQWLANRVKGQYHQDQLIKR